jgi:hypothetical protein
MKLRMNACDEVNHGTRATELEVKALSASGQLARYRIVHFATHGALAGQMSGNAKPCEGRFDPKAADKAKPGLGQSRNRLYGARAVKVVCAWYSSFCSICAAILSFSNRDGKGKRKTTSRTASFFLPAHFSSSTGPQAFSRPDRRMPTPVRAGRVKTGRPSRPPKAWS